MLKEIEIKQHFQLENVKIELSNNLNLIIGESGSGKSLLVEAIAFLNGYDLTKETSKQGTLEVVGIVNIDAKMAKIRRLFERDKVTSYIDDIVVKNYDYEDIMIRHSNYYDQKYVHNYGINTNHILNLMDATKLECVKEYTKNFDSYNSVYERYEEYSKEICSLEDNDELQKVHKDLGKYDLSEIKRVTDEYESMGEMVNKMARYQEIYSELRHNEDVITKINLQLSKIKYEEVLSVHDAYISFMLEYQDRMEEIKKQVNELSNKLENFSNYNNMISVKNKLCRIYSCNLDELIIKKDKIEESLIRLDEIKEDRKNIENCLRGLISKLDNSNDEVNELLINKSVAVLKDVNSLLNSLGFACSEIKLISKKRKLNKYKRIIEGNYIYEIIIQDASGLKKIRQLSGGELSRLVIALSLQEVKFKKGNILLYDEIDTGISGEFSVKIGKEFSNASRNNQLIAISHNPQVCAKADKLIRVEKSSSNSYSIVKEISTEEIEIEISKMILGNIYDKKGIEVAKLLINK